jgi:acetoin utilization deacetylase AcuC-like enzyme
MRDAYGGFCYLNNAAIAARYLQNAGGLCKIAILDIDYHHGNGTQEIFYHDPSVLYCSLHADPQHDYPYFWGGADEAGEGQGEGFNCNWPLPLRCTEDDYLHALCQALDQIASHAPEALIVSLGLDIVAGDPLGGFEISQTGIGQIGAMVAATSSALAIPTLIVQEGGYHLETLGAAVVAFLENFVV